MARDLSHLLEVCLARTAQLCGLGVETSGCDRELLFRGIRADDVVFAQFLQHVSDDLGIAVAALVSGPAASESFDAFGDRVAALAAAQPQRPGHDSLSRSSPSFSGNRQEETAIVGVACRLPGHAGDADTFWTVLSEGKDGIMPIPVERWGCSQLSGAENERGTIYVKEGGFIESIEEFDNRFFQISASEVRCAEPPGVAWCEWICRMGVLVARSQSGRFNVHGPAP